MKSLSVKGIFVLLLLAFVAPIRGRGQTVTCTVQAPCVEVTWQNAAMAATVTFNAAGVEVSGPGFATVWRCTEAPGVTCAGSTFGSSAWTALGPGTAAVNASSGTVAQISSAGQYYDQTIGYGTSYVYVVTDTWVSATGTILGTSARSTVFEIAPKLAAPSGSLNLAAVTVTSGSFANAAP